MKKKSMSLLFLGGLLVSSQLLVAEVYTWTDADGKPHFSQKPPIGIDYQTIEPEPTPAASEEEVQKRRESYQDSYKAALKKREEKQAKKAEEATQAAQQQELCDRARKMNETLTTRRRVTGEGGAMLTDQQRGEYLRKTADLMQANCR